jgi:hypothetical protein
MRLLLRVLPPLLLLAGCASHRFSTRCTDELNHCLDTCPPRVYSPIDQREAFPGGTVDARSTCERRCHDFAQDCEKREARSRASQPAPEPSPVPPPPTP